MVHRSTSPIRHPRQVIDEVATAPAGQPDRLGLSRAYRSGTSATRTGQPPRGGCPATAISPPRLIKTPPTGCRRPSPPSPPGRIPGPWRWRPGPAGPPRARSILPRPTVAIPGTGAGLRPARVTAALRSEITVIAERDSRASPTVGSTRPPVHRAAASATADRLGEPSLSMNPTAARWILDSQSGETGGLQIQARRATSSTAASTGSSLVRWPQDQLGAGAQRRRVRPPGYHAPAGVDQSRRAVPAARSLWLPSQSSRFPMACWIVVTVWPASPLSRSACTPDPAWTTRPARTPAGSSLLVPRPAAGDRSLIRWTPRPARTRSEWCPRGDRTPGCGPGGGCAGGLGRARGNCCASAQAG